MSTVPVPRGLVIIGNSEPFHLAAHLLRAARQLAWPTELVDTRPAYAGPRWLRVLLWRLAGRRPARLGAFSREVVLACARVECSHLLTTGLAPVRAEELRRLGERGVKRMNYLSDDPWNPAHRAPWFLAALREYDVVFNPRRQNLEDLRRHGCRRVEYLPFAYDPVLHAPAGGATAEERAVDVLFAGGADADRLPHARALIAAGLKVALYGGYWDRHVDLRPHWRGHADLATLCRVTPAAKLVLCLVRRANRDGHAMRSFEAPAMRGCLLMEDTPEHRDLFGPDGECAVYFRDIPEMVAKAKDLSPRVEERARLAAAAHRRICAGGHTYADRLRTMLAE